MTDWARVRALLAPLHQWDAMTDDERTEAAKPTMRQRILGSLNDTHALNGHERDRGAVSLDTFALIGFSIALLGVTLGIYYPVIGWSALGFIVAWVAVSIPFAVVVGRRIGGRP